MSEDAEIKAQIKYIVDKFQKAMAEFDELKAKFSQFDEHFNQLHLHREKQNELLKANAKTIDQAITATVDIRSLFNDFVRKNESQLDSVVNHINSISEKIPYFDNSFVSMNKKLVVLEKGQENQKDFLTSVSSALNEKDKIILDQNKKISVLESKIKDSEDLILSISQRCVDLQNFQDNLSSSIEKLNEKLNSLDAKSTGDSNFVKELLAQKLEKFSKHYDAKIADVKVPSVDGFVKYEELLKFTNDLDLTRLDAKNGYLKATNCAAEISMMGKKIEQLQLQLKSQSLSGG
jgi:chromosome segregation ATPase